MTSFQLLIGRVLKLGVFLAILLVLIGGITYLHEHGFEKVRYQTFQYTGPGLHASPIEILKNIYPFTSLAIIQAGLLVLVFIQLVRVILTMWMFMQMKEKIFALISCFISLILIFSFSPSFLLNFFFK